MTPDQIRSRTKAFMDRPTRGALGSVRKDPSGMGDRIRNDVHNRIGSQWQGIFQKYGVQMNNPMDFFNPDTRRSLINQLSEQLRARAQTPQAPGRATSPGLQLGRPAYVDRQITRPGVVTGQWTPGARSQTGDRQKLIEDWKNRGR